MYLQQKFYFLWNYLFPYCCVVQLLGEEEEKEIKDTQTQEKMFLFSKRYPVVLFLNFLYLYLTLYHHNIVPSPFQSF